MISILTKIAATLCAVLCAVAVSTCLPGCGGAGDSTTTDESTKKGSEQAADSAKAEDGDTKPAVSTNDPTSGGTEGRTDDDGRKWIGKIPYDVFFRDPLGEAANSTAVAVNNTPAAPDAGGATDAPKSDDPPPTAVAGGKPEWDKLIPAKELNEEVTKIRNRFNEKLTTVGAYNRSNLELPPYQATLAALAGIATQHPGDVSWKPNARHVRDLAAGVIEDPPKTGAKAFRDAKEKFAMINDILNGSPPAGLPESAEETDFSAVADMGLLMKRFKGIEDSIRLQSSSEDALKANKEDLKREAYTLAALSKVLTTEGYGYSDDAEFKAHVDAMIVEALKMADAVKDEAVDFEKFDLAANAASQRCTKCHMTYRGN